MAISATQNIINAVKNYGNGLFSFIRGRVKTEEDAQDIIQDVWYQLSNVVDTDEIEQMSGWLFKVARNKIIDLYRKKTTDSLEDMSFQNEDGDFDLNNILMADDNDPETVYMKEMFWQELLVALDGLPPNQRDVFVWNELEDKTLQQIADETGEKLKTIISRKGYAVKYLRTRLDTLYRDFINY